MEAGADIEDRCWDTSPLMAAAHSGHIWAVETLVTNPIWARSRCHRGRASALGAPNLFENITPGGREELQGDELQSDAT